jgi:pimeloyl-ACP methyl ester carboxylesterase
MEPVLLLHGALGSSDQLEPLKTILQSKGKQVYTLNFSGHGGNAFEFDFGIEQFADEVADFIRQHSLPSATIFGYSMGGYVAVWLALKYPELVKRIVTLGTKFDWSPESAAKEIRKMDPEKIIAKVPAFARILEHRHKPNDWKSLMRKTAEMMHRLGESPLLTEFNLKNMQANLLVLLGDQDDMADLSFSKQVVDIMPNGKFLLLENTQHPIEKIDPLLLANLILIDA